MENTQLNQFTRWFLLGMSMLMLGLVLLVGESLMTPSAAGSSPSGVVALDGRVAQMETLQAPALQKPAKAIPMISRLTKVLHPPKAWLECWMHRNSDESCRVSQGMPTKTG